MSSQVPSITVLRERATQLLGRGCVRGQLKAMMAGAFAAKNAGTPLDPESTSQELVTQCQGLINQADQDVLAILVRELLEFVENGGGGGGDAPAVIAPFPGIGAEGEYYAQQIRTTGATPQTFSVTDGSVPNGVTLNEDTGLLTGVCSYPFGGLYTGTITVTNEKGTVDYDFSILINGTQPTLSYDTSYGAFPVGTLFVEPGTVNNFDATATGSSGGYPVVPLVFTVSTSPAGANFQVDASTGELIIEPPSTVNGNFYTYGVTSTNYFGAVTFSKTMYVLAPIYWGEWHGALPGTFTASNITDDLFNDTTPGPRVISGMSVYELAVGNPVYYPETASPYYRVLAIPRGFTNGTLAQAQGDGSELQPVSVGTLAEFDPPWPDTYQPDLTINGIPYQIYVYAVGATTGAIELFFGQNFSPNPPLIQTTVGFNEFLVYAGQPNFLAAGRLDMSDTKIQFETTLGLGPFTWSGTGTLPTGLTWNPTTHEITGTPTDGTQVFERFIFLVTATNAGGLSNTLAIYIAVSAPIYAGELSGSLPGSFSASDITAGLYNVTTPGPRMYPSTVMAPAALGFMGIVLPGFYGHGESSESAYPGIMNFPLMAGITTRVFAVPVKFFSGSWAQDPYGIGASETYSPQIVGLFGSTGTATYNPSWPTPYQTNLAIDANGVSCLYNIYVIEGSSGFYAYWV